jgi:transcriptional regulator with XRE-family HTH domain
MEFAEKIKQLRTQKNLTQEELSEKLFVSRVTVSKWESGRGYPNIDSLKLMAKTFSTTIDELLSSEEIVMLAEQQIADTSRKTQSRLFGIIDTASILFLLVPFYSNYYPTHVDSVILSRLHNSLRSIIAAHYAIVIGTIVFGILELALQNSRQKTWVLIKIPVSLSLTISSILLSMVTRQSYVSLFSFFLFLIKVFSSRKNSREP